MKQLNTFEEDGVRVAVVGCGHGSLDVIYTAVQQTAEIKGQGPIDLLIIGGDFQAVRNATDLTIMSVPAKYRRLGDFPSYYSGESKAPILTIFVGGNHEASSHLWELYYGGWVAPNIYYLGAANVLRFGPIRIAGMSGIWNEVDYYKPHFERLPFNYGDIKGFYHVREIDVRKLLLVREQVDVGLSHDWPNLIERFGDLEDLLQRKPHFRRDSTSGRLGSTAAANVMDRLRPRYWFSAHMHCKFTAIKTYPIPTTVPTSNLDSTAAEPLSDHSLTKDEVKAQATRPVESVPTLTDVTNSHSLQLSGSTSTMKAPNIPNIELTMTKSEKRRAQLPAFFAPSTKTTFLPVPSTITNTTTCFMALDKPLPKREFLEVLNISPGSNPHQQNSNDLRLQYDPEWLAITRVFHSSLVIGQRGMPTPTDLGEAVYWPMIDQQRVWVEENVVQKGWLNIPENFAITAPHHKPGDPENTNRQPDEYTNPQTTEFCRLLGLENLWDASDAERRMRRATGPPLDEPNDLRGTNQNADRNSKIRGHGIEQARFGGREATIQVQKEQTVGSRKSGADRNK